MSAEGRNSEGPSESENSQPTAEAPKYEPTVVGRVVAWTIGLGLLGGVGYLIYDRHGELEASRSRVVEAEPVARVEVVTVAQESVDVKLTYPATLEALTAIEVRPIEAKGYVTKVTVDKGDKVKRGQLLIQVDCPEYHARRRQAQETVRSAKAIYDLAKAELGRLGPMRQKGFVSELEIDNAEAAFRTADARTKNAEARLHEVEKLIAFCSIRAPFSGEVVMRYIDPGEQVRPGRQRLLTLAQRDQMRVLVSVVERDLHRVAVGAHTSLEVQGFPGRRFEGEVTRILRSLNRATRTFIAEIQVDNGEHALQPGMSGRVWIDVEQRAGAVVVPASAVLATDEGASVFVVQGERVRQRPVKLGHDSGLSIEIAEGLAKGERVVVTGRDLVADGRRVSATERRTLAQQSVPCRKGGVRPCSALAER